MKKVPFFEPHYTYYLNPDKIYGDPSEGRQYFLLQVLLECLVCASYRDMDGAVWQLCEEVRHSADFLRILSWWETDDQKLQHPA